MKQFSLFLFFFISAISLKAQSKSDSLIVRFEGLSTSIEKIETGFQVVASLMNNENEKAIIYANKNLFLAKELNDSLNIALNLDDLGELNRKIGNYEEAIKYLEKSLSIKENIAFAKNKHETFNILGKVYANQGTYDKSAKYFLQALYIMEDEGNKEGQAFYLNNIGVVFDLQGIYDKALDYYLQSLAIKEEIGMEKALGASYNNIGIAYFNLGKVEKSLEYHQKALKENIKFEKTGSVPKSYNNIGFAYISLNKLDSAVINLRKALQLWTNLGEKRAIAHSEINLGVAFNDYNRLDSALLHCNKGIDISKEIGVNEILKNGYELLSEIYTKQSKFEQALTFYKLHDLIKDTLRNEDAFAKIAEMEAKYNLVKKEQEIQSKNFEIENGNLQLEKELSTRNFYFALLIGSVLTLLLIGFGYAQKRRINTLLKAQNLLIQKSNKSLEDKNTSLNTELADKTKIIDNVFTKGKSSELPPELLELSKREMEVLSYLALGWTDQQISDKLFVSKSTTKTHLRRIYSKLLVNGRAGAVAIAHKYNIIGGENNLASH